MAPPKSNHSPLENLNPEKPRSGLYEVGQLSIALFLLCGLLLQAIHFHGHQHGGLGLIGEPGQGRDASIRLKTCCGYAGISNSAPGSVTEQQAAAAESGCHSDSADSSSVCSLTDSSRWIALAHPQAWFQYQPSKSFGYSQLELLSPRGPVGALCARAPPQLS